MDVLYWVLAPVILLFAWTQALEPWRELLRKQKGKQSWPLLGPDTSNKFQ